MKMVIADDEVLTLNMLEKLIEWDKLGISIAGMAMDGEEALKFIEEQHPDILITDIRMPKMDGLELIKEIRDRESSLKIIILSAYGEFEYAQRALAYGVTGFLLKPVDEEKLEQLVCKAADEIKKENIQAQNYSESKRMAQERIMRQLLFSRSDIPQLLDMLDRLGMSIDFSSYQLLNICIDSLSYDEHIRFEEMEKTVSSDIVRFIQKNTGSILPGSLVFENNPGEWVMLVDHSTGRHSGETKKQIHDMADKIVHVLKEKFEINSFVGISKTYHDASELHKAYTETLDMMKYRFYFGDKSIFDSNYLDKGFKVQEIKIAEQEKLLIEYLGSGQETEALKLVNELFSIVDGHAPVDPEQIYALCFKVLILIRQRIMDADIPAVLQEVTMEGLKRYKTLKDLKSHIVNIVEQIINQPSYGKTSENNRLIKKAKEYIQLNYNTNITLEDISESIAVSKNYFCYLFKREMGESLWDYLTRVRIEKAKELFKQTGLKNYEVAYKVGYESPSYFTKMFKKITGFTPQEFRDK